MDENFYMGNNFFLANISITAIKAQSKTSYSTGMAISTQDITEQNALSDANANITT